MAFSQRDQQGRLWAWVLLGIVICLSIALPIWHLFSTKLQQKHPETTVAEGYINDASQLNLTQVHRVVDVAQQPEQMRQQLVDLLSYAKAKQLKVSIAGSRHSMGGHTIAPNGIVLNMLPYKHMQLDAQHNILHVGAGATWQDAIEYLDGKGKSIAIMQSFSNFSIGGSISVNGHGWQKAVPPLSASVESFSLMKANGEIVQCSRTENPELFKLVIGGYGLFGIILDVQLKVVDNVSLAFHSVTLKPENYVSQYQKLVRDNPKVQFAYGRLRISKKNFLEQATLNYFEQTPEQPEFLASASLANEELRRLVFRGSVQSEYGKRLRWDLENTLNQITPYQQFSRNQILNEHSSLIENKDPRSTDLLHEYFIPEAQLQNFIHDLRPILKATNIDLLNITIREVSPDRDAFMNYAREPVFGLVFLFSQQKTAEQEQEMRRLTNALLDITLRYKGTYYLPYRLHIGREKMRLAYPQADAFFQLKKKYDPEEMFSNQFYEYYR